LRQARCEGRAAVLLKIHKYLILKGFLFSLGFACGNKNRLLLLTCHMPAAGSQLCAQ
jgi:hypothetical protein